MHFPQWATSRSYWSVTLAMLAGSAALAAWYAPVDAQMGAVQKLIYLHLPAAFGAVVGAVGVFAGSLASIWTREPKWDRVARAGAIVAVFSSGAVLATGMVWGKSFWGFWWTWSPRLTFTLVLFVLYLAYLVMRGVIAAGTRRAMVCAVYGALAFLDVPLLYLSARLLPDVHPTSVPLTGEMRVALAACSVSFLLLCVGLIAAPMGQRVRATSERMDAGRARMAAGTHA